MGETRTQQLEGRKREEWVGELRNVGGHKRGLINWRGGRGRSELVSFKMWQVTNEDSPTGGEEEGGVGWGLLKVGGYKRGLPSWGGGRWRSKVVSFENWHVINKGSLTLGVGEGGEGWLGFEVVRFVR